MPGLSYTCEDAKRVGLVWLRVAAPCPAVGRCQPRASLSDLGEVALAVAAQGLIVERVTTSSDLGVARLVPMNESRRRPESFSVDMVASSWLLFALHCKVRRIGC